MGAGGYISLVNGTHYDWKKVYVHSYQMNSWDSNFPDVLPAKTSTKVYIEFNEQLFNTWSDDGGSVDFALQGVPGNPQFRIQAGYKYLQAVLTGFPTLNHNQNTVIDLGFKHDGVVPFILAGTVGQFTTIGPAYSSQAQKNPLSYVSGCHVVYDTEPSDVVSDLRGDGNDINKGQDGDYVYLVADYSDSPQDACNSFDVRIQSGNDSSYQDLAKGAGGDFRFLVPSCDPNNSTKITSVRLLRSSSAVTTPPFGFSGMTGDINDGRGGDFLYVIWGTGPISPSSPASWMQANIKAFGSRTLSSLCIPGSHDAGMSDITGGTAFGTSSNTQTQTRSIGKQLIAGSRWFDLRPVISGGKFKTGHYSNVGSVLGTQGANGQVLSDIISEINNFTANNHELVIFNLSHAIDTDSGRDYPDFSQTDWNNLFEELTGVQNRFIITGKEKNLSKLTLNDYIGKNTAAVLFIVPEEISLGAYATEGFYSSDNLNVFDDYTGTDNLGEMIADQLDKMRLNRGRYFLLSWTLTQSGFNSAIGGESILDLAECANESLYEDLFAACSYELFPNVIYVDDFNPNVAFLTVAINYLGVAF